jgi:uncharacterized membrane protein
MPSFQTDDRNNEQLAIGLGWFSIALGVAELTAPRAVARLIGVPEESSAPILRTMGAREIGSGLAILMRPDSATAVWSRVGGDMIDLSLLGYALNSDDTDKGLVGFAIAAVAGVTALDVTCAQRLTQQQDRALRPPRRRYAVQVEKVTTINRPIEQVYDFWRDFANLPRFMRHLESVEFTADRRSRWRAKAPAGMTVEWEAEMLEDRENEWIAWRSLPGSTVENSGSVRFQRAPGARGTEVRVQLQYSPPAGELGREIAWLFGEAPEQQVGEDLHRFKQLMETGEIPMSDGFGLKRPAQPVADPADLRAVAGVQP